MPIYEYRCKPCDHAFETLVRNASDTARCPICGNLEVEKQLSVLGAVRSGRSSLPLSAGTSTPQSGACGRPQSGSGSCGCH